MTSFSWFFETYSVLVHGTHELMQRGTGTTCSLSVCEQKRGSDGSDPGRDS